MTVRATRIEIFGFGRASGQRDHWKALAEETRRMTNRMWREWLCEHERRGTLAEIEAYLAARKRGEKPKISMKACDKELSNKIYHRCSRDFPTLTARVRVLSQNKWQGTITSRKAATGSLPGWWSILLCNEGQPSFNRPQPIPFDKDNGFLFARGEGRDKKLYLTVRLQRNPEDGKSLVEECELMLNRRKTLSQRKIIERVIAGEYAFKGSSICFDQRSGKWFASICYEMPAIVREDRIADRVMIVRPGRKSPWRITIQDAGGKWDGSWKYGGTGVHVEFARRTIQRERGSRKEHYRWAGSNQKGHGVRRAEAVWTKLSSRWKDFTKRYNNEVTKQLVRTAIQRRIGTIIYCQPRDDERSDRYLSVAGNDGQSQMSWDYFQFGTMLAQKAQHDGIDYEEKKQRKAKVAGDGVPSVRQALPANGKKRAGKKAGGVRKV